MKIENIYIRHVIREQYENINDKVLLENFYAEQNNQWLGILLQRYTLLLLGVCMKYLKNEEDARDAVQHIFLKAIIELKKYRVEYFKSWLYMVAKNHCLMQIRSKNGKTTKEISDSIKYEEKEEQSSFILENENLLTLLEQSLEELSKEQKTCVTLFYLRKKSYSDIVKLTGYTIMQVKSHIQNGKRNLKSLVEKKMKSKWKT